MFIGFIRKKRYLFFAFLFASAAQANIVVLGTRVIYPQNTREVTLRIENKGELPSLVQVWMDNGGKNGLSESKIPFVMVPPVFRVESKKTHAIRIVYTGGVLPKDRESVFWINVLNIPPKGMGNSENILQMAIRSRLKLFFRPEGLGSESALLAAEKITWKLDNQRNSLIAVNPSPYHINIANISGVTLSSSTLSGMITPYSEHIFSLKSPSHIPLGSQINYKIVNDFGALVDFNSKIEK